MSWIGRFGNLFRRDRLTDELEEELASHIEEAIESGRHVDEARRAFGAALRHREQSRDIKLLPLSTPTTATRTIAMILTTRVFATTAKPKAIARI